MRVTPGMKLGLMDYLLSIPLVFKFPVILIGPLLAEVVNAIFAQLLGVSGSGGIVGSLTQSIAGLVALLISATGLAIAILVADSIWRYKRASFDDAWESTKARLSGILYSAIGISMIVYVAGAIGDFTGQLMIGLILVAAGWTFLVYALPAAAIGGTPPGLAIDASIQLVRKAPFPSALLMIFVFIAYFGFGTYLPLVYLGGYGIYSLLISALLKAIALAYIALIITKRYSDLSFSTRWN